MIDMAPKMKAVLVISPVVPRADTNSGGNRLFRIISFLTAQYKVYFYSITTNNDDDFYINRIKNIGVHVLHSSTSIPRVLIARRYSLVFLEFYHIAPFFIDRICILQPNCKVIIDSVDVHYVRHALKYQITKSELDYDLYNLTKDDEINAYKRADAVITVTDDDANILKTEDPNIDTITVSNVHAINAPKSRNKNYSLLFVGDFRHEPNVDAIEYFYSQIWPYVQEASPEVHLTIIGGSVPKSIKNMSSGNITVTGHVPSITPYLHANYVSIAPLRFGGGMKGKIGEAMAHGLPVVTTSVGATGMRLTHADNVLIADTPKTFADAILELFTNEALYSRITENSIRHINSYYLPQQISTALQMGLSKILEKDRRSLGFYQRFQIIRRLLMVKYSQMRIL